ncbi:PREDICTED: mitochondrial basic amino acids transporter-like [Myotis brandtii]|uniref:mitochondrial basic amino acids transporter-like n=1 Tax=Myotis brandtii TaxID=109478 RepID=UPI000703C949|nr:PREDICTED: mitochondrial basic amino acids transporter-like [Myotis brandtii]
MLPHPPAMRIKGLRGGARCTAGVAGVLVGHPFDTVKVRLQVQSLEKPQYRGTLHCFQSIIKQESVLGLYKGLGSPLMGLTFINALVFGVQGNTLRALGQDSPMNQFLAGAAAGSTLLRAFPVNAATFATVTIVLTYARGPEDQSEDEGVPAASGPALAQPSSL